MSEGVPMPPDVYVIAPDKKAGEDFSKVLENKGINARQQDAVIPPRVVSYDDEKNVMNRDRESVSEALANAIEEVMQTHEGPISISCNTLSLPEFVNRSREILKSRGIENPKLITTLDSIKEKYEGQEIKPLFLGTTVLSGELPKDFNTLAHHETEESTELMHLVQEVIWREKFFQNSNVDTAPKYDAGDLNNQAVYDERLLLLHDKLVENGMNDVILGCTELPGAFGKMKDLKEKRGEEFKIKTIDPADIVADKIKGML